MSGNATLQPGLYYVIPEVFLHYFKCKFGGTEQFTTLCPGLRYVRVRNSEVRLYSVLIRVDFISSYTKNDNESILLPTQHI